MDIEHKIMVGVVVSLVFIVTMITGYNLYSDSKKRELYVACLAQQKEDSTNLYCTIPR